MSTNTNCNDIEQAIKDKGLTAPRVTAQEIDALVDSLMFKAWTIPDTTTTVVAAILPDGFVIALGKSASVNKANFDAEIGRSVAKDNAIRQARETLWELKGWELKQRLK